MKKIILIIIVLINWIILISQTTIPEGDVSGTWTLTGSPFLIEGEITIPDGESLSIDSGVHVEFQGHYTLNVQGQLLAIGTVQDSISFTVNDTTGFYLTSEPDGAWNGIHFYETPATNDSSKIVYCILEFSKTPIEQYTGWNGGAIYIYDYSKVLVSHCFITNNRAQSGGGLCIMETSNPIIDSNTISFNITDGIHSHGGGICIRNYSNPTISNNIINHNLVNGQNNFGGGLHISEHSEPILENNVIRDNSVFQGFGSGLSIFSSDPILINNRIEFNQSITNQSQGGGIYIWYNNASPVLINNIISNNAGGNGGAISYSAAKPILINNTITNNTAYNHGGGIYRYVPEGGNITIINSIFYNNQPEEIYIFNLGPDIFTIANSIIEGGEAGMILNGNVLNWLEGNLDTDPMFVDSLNYDYHLQDISPAIGAGIDSLEIEDNCYYAPVFDLDGNPRPNPIGSMPDIGAYENPYGEPQVGIENYTLNIEDYILSNHPNPFNPTTIIEFSIQNDSEVKLSIYNLRGQKIRSLLNNQISAGERTIVWNGTDDNNKPVSSGVYLYKLNINGKTEAINKCLLLK